MGALMKGYMGKILFIRLDKKELREETFREEFAMKYIGGKGFGAYYLNKLVNDKVDALSKNNPLILANGPLNGTRIPLTSKAGFFFKSPLTGGYGESIVGGSLPKYPKWVGYDAIIILGKADKPTILVITEDGIDFMDGSDLWGRNIEYVDNALRKEFGKKSTVVAIGPAGENLVKFAVIGVDKWRQAARTGGGAVMGSKQLKAIVFISDDNWVDEANPSELRELISDIVKKRGETPGVKTLNQYGTSAMATLANEMGFFPSYYWSKGQFEDWERISAESIRGILKKNYACWNCFIACGRYVSVDTNYGHVEIDGPEYETIYALGGLIGVRDLKDIVYLNYLADILGLDTITLGNVLGFAVEASKRGKIDFKVDYDDTEKFVELIRMITYRQGIGEILAEGVVNAARKLGLEELAIHVKGLELAGYDPRTLKGMSIGYAISPRGACHLRTMAYYVDIKGFAGPPEELSERKILKIIEFEDFMTAFDSLMICKFGRDIFKLDVMWRLYNAVTGFNIKFEDFKRSMERVTLLTRLFNEKNGFSRRNDYLPERLFREKFVHKGVRHELSRSNFEKALDLYYEYRGIDNSGLINPQKKRELGIDRF